MNLLTEGVEKNLVQKTDLAIKLTIDGVTASYPVYRIRLDCLYYNDRNDRIATWINKYRSEHDGLIFDKSDIGVYNSIIHQFIEESNPDAIKRTENNIGMVNQREPGVVLLDGRIIDGNRRFTCLRNLSKKDTQKFNYFEAAIIKESIESNEKQIKMLELQLQMGAETRVDYNPIDRLVGVYQDIVENKLLTVKEYAQSANKSEAEVNKDVELAKLLVEFLEMINAPKQFYMARDMDLNGPLVELNLILKNAKDDEYKNQIKNVAFVNLLTQPDGDMTRFIRNMKQIVKAPAQYLDEFLEKELECSEKIINGLPPVGKVTPSYISELRSQENVKEKFRQIMDLSTTKVKALITKNIPLKNVMKAIELLNSIDSGMFEKLSLDQRMELKQKIGELIERCEPLRDKLDVSGSAT